MTDRISINLLEWYDLNARSLPWRISPMDGKEGVIADPYQVWLSEIMLQQTQVVTVQSYFLKFIKKWPNVMALAKADTEDVMKAWAGLGYYSRARNLKRCAEIIAFEMNGIFPQNAGELKSLPGIGDYTSAAIGAIAFGEKIAVMDGNVERVFARLFRISDQLPAAKKPIFEKLNATFCTERPGDFAQACMDLGATLCTPKKPNCMICPLTQECQARAEGDMESYPVRAPKRKKPTRKGAAFVIEREDGAIFLQKRPDSGLLGGMSIVPTTNWNSNQDGETGNQAGPIELSWEQRGEVRHTFTHFHLELEVWFGRSDAVTENGWWSQRNVLAEEALPGLMKKVLEQAIPGCTQPKNLG